MARGGPIYREDKERVAARKELADFCGVPVEELFPPATPDKLPKKLSIGYVRKKYRGQPVIYVRSEDWPVFLGLAELITTDKYGPGRSPIHNEVGLIDGKRVMIYDL